ncbi:MAG: condensation domain-containing protein, partial [Myxococcota bacterium]
MSDEIRYAAVDYDPFADPPIIEFPATEAQRELWGAVLLGADASRAYNESVTLELEGPVELDALLEAIRDLPRMHEALRASFSDEGSTVRIAPHIELDLGVTERPLEEILETDAQREYDLENGPLFRASVVRKNAERHWVVLAAHHIVCDGWSFGVLLSDLAARYNARKAGDGDPSPQGSFQRYAEEERQWTLTSGHREAQHYWLERLGDVPAAVDLPTDTPRPALKSFRSKRADARVSEATVQALKKAAAKSGASLFAALLAGFNALVYRLSGQETVVVGVPTAGQ